MAVARLERFRNFAADWARRRQGSDQRATELLRRRIYILPTSYGLAFGCMVVAMLLGSLNYAANLGFAMTFLMFGLGLVVMHHCHNNLLAICVRYVGAEPVFAGQTASFRLTIQNDARTQRFDISTGSKSSADGPVDIEPGSVAHMHIQVPALQRGRLELPRFSVSTRFPANLFRAWAWLHMDGECLVYPEPAPTGTPFPDGSYSDGNRTGGRQHDDDFAGLREAVDSDPPKRLAWKAFARSDQLLAKEFSGGSNHRCMFDFNQLAQPDTETKLSQLTRWCLDAAEAEHSFGLQLPNQTIAPDRGDRHLHACLRALALYGQAE